MKFPNHSFAKCNNDALTQLLVMHFPLSCALHSWHLMLLVVVNDIEHLAKKGSYGFNYRLSLIRLIIISLYNVTFSTN